MKNRKVIMLLLLCVYILPFQLAYAEEGPNEQQNYHIKISGFFIEQPINGDTGSFKDYGVGSDGLHKYEAIFLGDSYKEYDLRVVGKDGKTCQLAQIVEPKKLISNLDMESATWKLTTIVNSACNPENAEVIDNGNVKFSAPIPEIQIRADHVQLGTDRLLVTSSSGKAIEILGFFDTAGNKSDELEVDGSTQIGADTGNLAVVVMSTPAITYLAKSETYKIQNEIKYKVDGEEKSQIISVTYYNDMDKDITLSNEKTSSQSWTGYIVGGFVAAITTGMGVWCLKPKQSNTHGDEHTHHSQEQRPMTVQFPRTVIAPAPESYLPPPPPIVGFDPSTAGSILLLHGNLGTTINLQIQAAITEGCTTGIITITPGLMLDVMKLRRCGEETAQTLILKLITDSIGYVLVVTYDVT